MLADITSDERGVGEGELLRHGQPLRHLLLSFLLPFSLLPAFPRITSTVAAAATSCAVASLGSAAAELGFLRRDGREEAGPRRERDGSGGGATREQQQQRGLRGGDRRRGARGGPWSWRWRRTWLCYARADFTRGGEVVVTEIFTRWRLV
jgi:hypothetical protein